MNGEVLKYFEDLYKCDLTIKDNVFVKDTKFKREQSTISSNVRILHYHGIPFYAKDIYGKYSIQAMCASKMYRDLGINTPPIYPIHTGKVHSAGNDIAIMSQDVRSIKEFFAEQLFRTTEFKKFRSRLGFNDFFNNKWEFLLNENTKRKCLQFMTEECYNQILDMCIVDELRTDKDRGPDNFFLYKNLNSELYEGVIVIDLDLVHALTCKHPNKTDFSSWSAYSQYSTFIPLGGLDQAKPYEDRIIDMIQTIKQGKFSERHVNLIKRYLNFDFAGLMRKECKSLPLKKYSTCLYETYARLGEYNRKLLGPVLEP